MHEPPANTAAIYVKEPARAHPTGAGTDATTQLAEALQYCADLGLTAAAQYEDRTGSREAFQKMMADATSDERPYSHIVVWKLMYFALMIEDSIRHRDQLRAHGVRVLSVKERQPGDQPTS